MLRIGNMPRTGRRRKMRRVGVCWDFNGVIVDDEKLQWLAYKEVLAGYVRLTRSIYEECCLGRTDTAGFQNLRERYPDELSSFTVQEMVESKLIVYANLMVPEEILYPGAVEVLKSLRDWPCAIVTSSKRSEVLPVVKYLCSLGITFAGVVTADEVSTGKPDPEGYQKGLETLNLPPWQAVAVEDSPVGIKAATAARLFCIGILHTTTEARLIGAGADVVVPSIKEISPKLIQNALERKGAFR